MNNPVASAACVLVVATSAAAGSNVECDAVRCIERYCAASWRQAGIAQQDWGDCTQQVFLDLLRRVSRERFADAVHQAKSRERRELNRAIWCAAQRWRRVRRHYPLGDDEVPDIRQAGRQAMQSARELVAETSAELTEQQRAILSHTLDGAAIAEIAAALDAPVARISDDKYKALRKLRQRALAGTSGVWGA